MLSVQGTPGSRGVLATQGISSTSGDATVTLNGGVIEARTNRTEFSSFGFPGNPAVVLASGGGYFDTASHNIGHINVTSLTGDPSLDFAGSALTQIEIGSLGSFDRVSVDGFISYAGTLQIEFLNSYLPNVGDSFQIFTVGMAATGAFDHIMFSNPDHAASFNASNGTLQITAIPEPCGVALLVAALAGMLLRRSR
jgi:hypothetical protein